MIFDGCYRDIRSGIIPWVDGNKHDTHDKNDISIHVNRT